MRHTMAPTTDVSASAHSAVCMLWMNGASRSSDSPDASPEKICSSTSRGTAFVMTASTNAIDRTAPVFWSIIRAPAAIPRRCAGTTPIIAAVFGELNMPEPIPTIVSQRHPSQYGVWTASVVIDARPAALTSMPPAASARDPWRSAHSPANGDATSIPSAKGASFTPAVIGSSPCAPW